MANFKFRNSWSNAARDDPRYRDPVAPLEAAAAAIAAELVYQAVAELAPDRRCRSAAADRRTMGERSRERTAENHSRGSGRGHQTSPGRMELARDRPEVRMPSHGVLPRFEAAAAVIGGELDRRARRSGPGPRARARIPLRYRFRLFFVASDCCMLTTLWLFKQHTANDLR
jgi:hypothetical protein